MGKNGLFSGVDWANVCVLAGCSGFWAPSGHTEGVPRPQAPAGNHQVGQPEQGLQLRRIPRQPPIARLAVLEQVLDDVERMLDLGAQARLDALEGIEQPTHLRAPVLLLAYSRSEKLACIAQVPANTVETPMISKAPTRRPQTGE